MPFAACSVQVVCLVVFRRCFYSRLSAQHVSKQSNQVSRIQYCVSADFCLCQSRNCPHNCSTVLCVPSYATLLSFSIVSDPLVRRSPALLQLPNLFTYACRHPWPQSKAVRHPQSGPRWRHIHVGLISSRRAVVVPLTPQIPQSPPLFIGKSMRFPKLIRPVCATQEAPFAWWAFVPCSSSVPPPPPLQSSHKRSLLLHRRRCSYKKKMVSSTQ